tara:strand:+ start:572 stop:970 length:399 start_codon:yes stop_codon:yes gene_type:complete
MKVGLSFSRCIRDIIEARVEFDDVLVIVSRTDFDPHQDRQWNGIWNGYRYGGMANPEWAGAEPGLSEEDASNVYRNLTKTLYDNGKLHQPRQFGSTPSRMPYYWLECVMTPEEHNPAQQKVWDNYQLITDLA